jgi:hypothetical protein
MVRFIYSGEETIITSLRDLDLLFEIFRLADKVIRIFVTTLPKSCLFCKLSLVKLVTFIQKGPYLST